MAWEELRVEEKEDEGTLKCISLEFKVSLNKFFTQNNPLIALK